MKKKVLSLLLVLAMALSMIPMASAAAPSPADYIWYGDGSAAAFTISDAEDFLGFLNIVSGSDGQTANNFEGKTVALAADIDMGGLDYPHTGNFNLKGTVTGGDGTSTNHSILNLNLEGLLNGRDAGCFDHLLIKDWTFNTDFGFNKFVLRDCEIVDVSYTSKTATSTPRLFNSCTISRCSLENGSATHHSVALFRFSTGTTYTSCTF